MVQTTIRLPEKLYEKLKQEAKKRGMSLNPYDYAYDYGTHYNWISLDQVKISEKSENQRKNYKSELEGKNIAITLLEILNIVKEYYDMV